jgi:hypothetical protein
MTTNRERRPHPGEVRLAHFDAAGCSSKRKASVGAPRGNGALRSAFWGTPYLVDLCGLCSWQNERRAGNLCSSRGTVGKAVATREEGRISLGG